MYYVGVDVHKTNSQFAVMDSAGKVLKNVSVPSSPEGVHQALGRLRTPFKVVLEASYAWEPMYDWLDEIAEEVWLAHPLKVRAIAEARIKTDRLDAEILAHLLRADLIPRAYAAGAATRERKRALRQRRFLVMMRGMIKNRIHALLTRCAVDRPDVSDLFGKKGMRLLKSVPLPDVDRALLNEDLRLLSEVAKGVENTETLLDDLSRDDPVVARLKSLPGIGRFLSVLIRYEIDDIDRFRTPKKLAAYAGLVPSTYQSGNRRVHGKLTKQGNKHLRWAMIEAVSPAMRWSPYIYRYYHRIKRKAGTGAARVDPARRVGTGERTFRRRHRDSLDGPLPFALGLHAAETAEEGLRAESESGEALAGRGIPGHSRTGEAGRGRDSLGG